jgi:hypothetical protein
LVKASELGSVGNGADLVTEVFRHVLNEFSEILFVVDYQ